jgi:hypothetical protein
MFMGNAFCAIEWPPFGDDKDYLAEFISKLASGESE